jgi:predicted nucleotidyltransferase
LIGAIVDTLRCCEPRAVYAFGSRVTGEARPDSDLDLAVLLGTGRHMPVAERLAVIDRLQRAVGLPVDLIVLDEARLPVKFEIIRHGAVLWQLDRERRLDAEEEIVRDYLDFRPFLESSLRDILQGTRGGNGPARGSA